MALKIETVERIFKFKDQDLPDPDPTMTTAQVLDFYSQQYPELSAGFVKEPEEENGKMIYEIGFSVGSKG